MSGWISRLLRPACLDHIDVPQRTIDIRPIVDSFDLLRTTTLEVTQAATSAAEALQGQLWDSEQRLQHLLDAIGDIVIIKDNRSRWIIVNRAAADVLCLPRNALLGKTVDEIIAAHPSKRAYLEELRETDVTDAAVWKGRVPQRYHRVIPRHGTDYHYDLMKTPTFNDDGSPKEMILVGRDVTSILDLDRRMKTCFVALNAASDPIVILNSEGNVFFSNDKFAQTYNTEHHNTLGKPLHEVLPGFPRFNEVWEIVHHNQPWEGDFHKFHISVMPVMNGVPYPIYYICTFKKTRC